MVPILIFYVISYLLFLITTPIDNITNIKIFLFVIAHNMRLRTSVLLLFDEFVYIIIY